MQSALDSTCFVSGQMLLIQTTKVPCQQISPATWPPRIGDKQSHRYSWFCTQPALLQAKPSLWRRHRLLPLHPWDPPGRTSITRWRCSWQLANGRPIELATWDPMEPQWPPGQRSWRRGERQNLHESLLADPTSVCVLVRRQGIDVGQKPVRL